MTPGLGARTRRTSGLRAQATPGVRSATLIAAVGPARGRRLQDLVDGCPARQPLQAALGGNHEVDCAVVVATENIRGAHPLMGDRFAGVVQRRLTAGRGADE